MYTYISIYISNINAVLMCECTILQIAWMGIYCIEHLGVDNLLYEVSMGVALYDCTADMCLSQIASTINTSRWSGIKSSCRQCVNRQPSTLGTGTNIFGRKTYYKATRLNHQLSMEYYT